MLVSRILYPIEVLGPGKRIGIWVCGCNHQCDCCSNPELWGFDKSKNICIESLYSIIETLNNNNSVEGFTISGGEPFDQEDELLKLLFLIHKLCNDIIVYTGYTIDELLERKSSAVNSILKLITVLIDGKYIDVLNDDLFMRGSGNQTIIILNDDYKNKYAKYFLNGRNEIQNFRINENEFISVGIHKRNFKTNLNNNLKKFGLVEK